MSYRHPSAASLLSELRANYLKIAESPSNQLGHAGDHVWDMRRGIDRHAHDLLHAVSGATREWEGVPRDATHEEILAWLDEAIARGGAEVRDD